MMKKSFLKKLCLILVIALVFLSAGQSAWSGFQEGLDAARRGDYATALKEWKPLAELGDVNAQFNLGVMYYNGQGVPKDYKIAVEWFRKSAEQGYAKAQGNVGWMYAKGLGVPKDYKLAVKWYLIYVVQSIRNKWKQRWTKE